MLNTHVAPWIIVGSLMGLMIQSQVSPDEARTGRINPGASREGTAPKRADAGNEVGKGDVSEPKTFAPSNDESNISVLLRSEAIQKEINLTRKQAKELDALFSTQFERIRPWMIERLNSSANPAKWAEVNAVCLQLSQQFDIEIKAYLRPNQARRLTQISIQRAGLHALLMPDVAEVLGLDPELQEAIRGILKESAETERSWETSGKQAELREYSKFGGKSWEEFRKSAPYLAAQEHQHREAKARRDEVHRQVYRLLTRSQRQKFERMGGEPFDPERHRPKVKEKTP